MNYNTYSNCAHSFGAELYRGCTDGYVNICTFEPNDGPKFGFSISLEDAKSPQLASVLALLTNTNVYFQVMPNLTDIVWPKRGTVKDVAIVPGFFADIDFQNPEKKQQALPTNDVEALKLFAPGEFMAPTFIVETGRGLHAYWVLEEPVVIADERVRLNMVAASAAFGSAFRSFALNKFGWKFDSTSDLARLGRLPGTFNLKGSTPLPVLWRTDPDGRRYSSQNLAREAQRHGVMPKAPGASTSIVVSKSKATLTPTVAEALRRSDGKWWIGQITKQDVKPNGASVVEGCAFLRHAIDKAASLQEPEWFDALRLVARTENGGEIAHAMSAPYEGYDPAVTEQKLEHAKSYDSDLTCDHIARTHASSGCATCPFRGKLHSPADLGDRSRHHVELLVNTAYVEGADEFFDLRRVTKKGVKADPFSRFHGSKRVFGKPADVVTKDPLAIRAHERAYRPDRPPGAFVEGATTYLNSYQAPHHEHSRDRARLFYRHLRYLIPNRAERKVVIRWLAHLVQQPWEKLGYAVALIGGQGTGKSWLLNLMIKVLGADNVRTSGGRSVTSQFNGHFAGKVLLGLEEVTITGRAEAYEGLKALITNEVAEFERKCVQQEELQTPRGVMVLSNDAYALHLPPDDRRFFVVQTPAQKHPGRQAYYIELFKLDDAFVASVYWSLKAVNLEGFSSKTPPFMTAAKSRMADYSRADIDVLVDQLVDEQRGPFAKALATWDELRTYIRDRNNDPKLTDKRIKRALEASGVIIDPQKRQCRLKVRSILFLIRCVDEVSNMTAADLTAAYKDRHPRFDKVVDDEPATAAVFEFEKPTGRGR